MTQRDTILCIEDYPENMQLFRRLVISRGYKFLEAENGTEGLAIVREKKVDLILLDVNLPDANGYDLAGWLRSNMISTNGEVPIILISANGHGEDTKKVLESGCSGMLTKPFNIDQFWTLIENLLQNNTSSPN